MTASRHQPATGGHTPISAVHHAVMSTEEKGAAKDQQGNVGTSVGWRGTIEEQYRKHKQNVEEYPYVWASYILVYGGFGLWALYRWRRLRKTEDRVRALQAHLKEIYEAKEKRSLFSVEKGPSSPPGEPPRQ